MIYETVKPKRTCPLVDGISRQTSQQSFSMLFDTIRPNEETRTSTACGNTYVPRYVDRNNHPLKIVSVARRMPRLWTALRVDACEDEGG